VIRREQLARLAYPNPGVTYSREEAGFTEFLQVEQALPAFGTRAALSRAGAAATAAAEAGADARLWALRTDAAAAVATLTARARMRVSQTGAQGSAGTPVLPDGRYSRSNRPGTRLWPPSIACQVWPHVAIIQM
jgi:hypothetical protein